MTRVPYRVLAAALLGAFILHPASVSPLLAASGSVQGRVTVVGGQLPSGSIVRATPLGGGAPLAAPVAADGSYSIGQIPEGAYQFDVIGPDGMRLGTAKTLVTPAPLQLNLVAKIVAVPPPPAAPRAPERTEAPRDAVPAEEEAAPPPRRLPRSRSGKAWKITAAIVGGLAIGLAAGGDDDNDASPSTP